MLSICRMVERKSDAPKGQPAIKLAIGSTRLQSCEASRDLYPFPHRDAAAEMARMEEVESTRKEQEKISGQGEQENKITQRMFRVLGKIRFY